MRWSKDRVFISNKFRDFGNAHLMLKIVCKTLSVHLIIKNYHLKT